jgi:eukaryotic-like serine/threonine-protein kinase
MSKQEASQIVSVGDVLAGKYRVEKVLGMGGMGVVVAATHLDLREVRAVKLMRPDAESEQSVERFLREARAVVRLRSEHVAEVYDVGRLESGAPYIVMEMLEGQDLAAFQKRRGPLPIDEAVLYVSQACHALAEAHAAGIIHRDLKPGNLFLTLRTDGSPCVKVLDFGISKHTSPLGEGLDPEMTGARDLMGSPLYMAPEQMRSARKVDARADVWSLGAILYKLLIGRAPFQAPTIPEIFAAALGKPARLPSSIRPEIPRGLDAVILRCLDKLPSRRYATAADLFTALRPFGPWGIAADEDGDATMLCSPNRRSSIPPVKVRLTPTPEPIDTLPIQTPDPRSRPRRSTSPESMATRKTPSTPAPSSPRSGVDMQDEPTCVATPRSVTGHRRGSAPEPTLVAEDDLEESTGASVAPWEGSRARAVQKKEPTRLMLVASLSALAALAGVALAAVLVRWPALPLISRDAPHAAGANVAGATAVTPTAPMALPSSATSAAVPAALPAGSAKPEAEEETPSEDKKKKGHGAEAPAGKDVVPVKASQGSAPATSHAKPRRPGARGYDPFRGRH